MMEMETRLNYQDAGTKNIISADSSSISVSDVSQRRFIERHLYLCGQLFIIVPNGGSGDCLFKAVCQAVRSNDSDNSLNHSEVRKRVVEFIIRERWDKFKESIEIQHIHGNKYLTKKWKSNPMKAYHLYMTNSGTLGSSSELNAAGELFRYNFSTIQEYSGSNGKVYRVENCLHFENSSIPFYFFFFTGDFDNGHWEYLQPTMLGNNNGPLKGNPPIPDGVYQANMTVIIDGEESTIEDWLKIHTYNTNDALRLKNSVNKRLPEPSPYPFRWVAEFGLGLDGSILLQEKRYKVVPTMSADLFSVLAPMLCGNDKPYTESAATLEQQVLTYRMENFNLLNYKLITQPYSHRFDIRNLKYMSMPLKGNVQDLLSAADIFGFSFKVFLKPYGTVESCKFVHVDRWGGESYKIESFFLHIDKPSGSNEEVVAKWWHLIPVHEGDLDEALNQPVEAEVQNEPIYNNNQIGDGSPGPDHDKEFPKNENIDINIEHRKVSPVGEHSGPQDLIEIHKKGHTQDDRVDRENPSMLPASEEESEGDLENNVEAWMKEGRLTLRRASSKKSHEEKKFVRKFQPKQLKTVVEMYDPETRQKKKYIYDGFIPKDNVLQALIAQGLIKPPTSADGDEIVAKINEDGRHSRPKLSKRKDKNSNFHVVEERVPELKTQTFDSGLAELAQRKILEAANLDFQFVSKHQSVSQIALVDEESLERTNKFQTLHRRFDPKVKHPTEYERHSENGEHQEHKSCVRRLLTCMSKIKNLFS